VNRKVLTSVLLIGLFVTPALADTPPYDSEMFSRDKLHDLINDKRQELGRNRLTVTDFLTTYANQRAGQIAADKSLSGGHDACSGCGEVIGIANVEPVTSRYGTAQRIFNAWMNSPGHKAVIMNPDATKLGCGYEGFTKDGHPFDAWACETRFT
jgi:uncharacterized protein YkwD